LFFLISVFFLFLSASLLAPLFDPAVVSSFRFRFVFVPFLLLFV